MRKPVRIYISCCDKHLKNCRDVALWHNNTGIAQIAPERVKIQNQYFIRLKARKPILACVERLKNDYKSSKMDVLENVLPLRATFYDNIYMSGYFTKAKLRSCSLKIQYLIYLLEDIIHLGRILSVLLGLFSRASGSLPFRAARCLLPKTSLQRAACLLCLLGMNYPMT